MLPQQRHELIRSELAESGSVESAALAINLGVSEDTIRRDLLALDREGHCRRVHGGAVVRPPFPRPLAERNKQSSDEKARLAHIAIKLIHADDTIFIDGGAINTAIAQAVPRSIPLTVATNALEVAIALAGHDRVKLIILGGTWEKDLGVCVGVNTLNAISQLSADLVFLGSCSVDPIRGVTTYDAAEAEVKRAMVQNSLGVVVATTLSQMMTTAPFRISTSEAINHLVICKEIPNEELSNLSCLTAKLHFA